MRRWPSESCRGCATSRPDLILISAGFDAHERDPLGGLRLTERDFSEATKRLMDIADRNCGGRIVSLLEGGYDLDALEPQRRPPMCRR